MSDTTFTQQARSLEDAVDEAEARLEQEREGGRQLANLTLQLLDKGFPYIEGYVLGDPSLSPLEKLRAVAKGNLNIVLYARKHCRALWDSNPRDTIAADASLLLTELAGELLGRS